MARLCNKFPQHKQKSRSRRKSCRSTAAPCSGRRPSAPADHCGHRAGRSRLRRRHGACIDVPLRRPHGEDRPRFNDKRKNVTGRGLECRGVLKRDCGTSSAGAQLAWLHMYAKPAECTPMKAFGSALDRWESFGRDCTRPLGEPIAVAHKFSSRCASIVRGALRPSKLLQRCLELPQNLHERTKLGRANMERCRPARRSLKLTRNGFRLRSN